MIGIVVFYLWRYIHFNPFSCTQASTTRRFVYAQIRSNKLNERDSPEGNVLSVNFYHAKKGWILSTLYNATIKKNKLIDFILNGSTKFLLMKKLSEEPNLNICLKSMVGTKFYMKQLNLIHVIINKNPILAKIMKMNTNLNQKPNYGIYTFNHLCVWHLNDSDRGRLLVIAYHYLVITYHYLYLLSITFIYLLFLIDFFLFWLRMT